ncbi:hypothetical protein H6F61_17020 [Cyanobacteria bacterium FACHB-472]|nr:hypothetical protein [Cyanobacteria bacterium FACHB-472]
MILQLHQLCEGWAVKLIVILSVGILDIGHSLKAIRFEAMSFKLLTLEVRERSQLFYGCY